MGDVERLKELVEAYKFASDLPANDKLYEALGGLLEAIILLTESVAKETKELCEKPERDPYWDAKMRAADIPPPPGMAPEQGNGSTGPRPFMTPPEPPAMREGECGRRVGDKPKRCFWFRG